MAESERDPVQGDSPEEREASAREHVERHRAEAPSSQAEIGAELNEYQADVSDRAAEAQYAGRAAAEGGGVPDPEDLPEGSAVENPERERTSMDYDLEPSEDPLERRAESEAAAQAGAIGGPAPDYAGDEENRPLEEGGEGVAEGFEESERELIESASHGDPRFSPDANPAEPEIETDLSTAEYGEADEEEPPDR
jgi:hypothetical protein